MIETNASHCNTCSHKDICKIKRSFENFNDRIHSVEEYTKDDGSKRFPDFSVTTSCKFYTIARSQDLQPL